MDHAHRCPRCGKAFDGDACPACRPVARPVAKPAAPVAKPVPVAAAVAPAQPVKPPVATPARSSAAVARPPARKPPEDPANESGPKAATTSKGRKWPLNLAVVIVAVIASGTLAGVLSTPLRWADANQFGFAYVFLCMFPGSVFGGAFATALAPHSPNRHCMWAAVWDGVVSLLLYTLVAAVYALQGSVAAEDGVEVPSLVSRLAPLVVGLLLLPVGYLLGGAIERGVTALGRSLSPREQWTYKTFDGVSFPVFGPWRHPVLAACWTLTGWLLILTCWMHFTRQAKNYGTTEVFKAVILGRLCFVMAQKRTGTSARTALEQDDRPPIVYLRSFQDDGVMLTGWWESINDVRELRILRRKTLEMRLIEVLGRSGPVVAIGRPGEDLPELGAARVYVGDDHWQLLIADLLNERGAVALLRAGETQGLSWEMRTVGELLPPQRVLLFLPFALKGTQGSRDRRYAAFRKWAADCFPAELPQAIGDVCLVYFDRDPAWETHVLGRDGRVPKDHPLRPILERVQDRNDLWPRRFFNWKRDRVALIVLLVVLGLVAAVCGFGWLAAGR